METRDTASVATKSRPGYRGEGFVLKSLRDLRHEAGLGLRELAQASGVSQGNLSRIERGKQLATATEITQLSDALGLDADLLEVRAIVAIEVRE